MANLEHLALLMKGAKEWNKYRPENPNLIGANLTGANLTGANLYGAILRRAALSGADLREASLHEAILSGADLRGADLSGADLRRANLCQANLTGANLREANMNYAKLSGTKGIVSMTFDPRGFSLVQWMYYGIPIYKAGCHDFDLQEAISHWGSPAYPDKELGEMYVRAIDFLETLAPENKSARPRVVIEVLGGVATVEECPDWVEVDIIDHDLEEEEDDV